jgi:hypothetical protein
MERARLIRKDAGAHRLTVFTLLVVLTVFTSGLAASAGPSGAGAVCKRGGWRHLVDANGRGFKNQGQCVKAAVHGRLSLNPQVTGPFTGTTSFEFGTHGCLFVFETFDGTYQTPSGTGTFHIEGCVGTPSSGDLFPITGSFTLTAPSGARLTGSVSGGVFATTTFAFEFTLAVQTATGSLTGATGVIEMTGAVQVTGGTVDLPITGTLTGDLTRS